jgi:phage terminase small subunit
MALTLKQENFCLAYIETGNASEAYRRAYDADKTSAPVINVNAKKLLDSNKIALRIAELRKPVIEQVQITLKSHLEKLAELRDKAEADEKWQPAIQAEVARGKASGLYVDKIEVTVTEGLADRLSRAKGKLG